MNGKHDRNNRGWIISQTDSATGPIPIAATRLNIRDKFGHLRVRWGIGRMSFTVPPGLYGIGGPDSHSPVLVTANYKMSFDVLRSQLEGRNAWILVLDTKGINVWCAAGKGTFGTEELVTRMAAVNLPAVVAHRKLILPQLGAPGVEAHIVAKKTGFKIHYGPVRAEDLPGYLDAGNSAGPEMRAVRFPLRKRLALIPVEIVGVLKPFLVLVLGFLIVDLIGFEVFSLRGLFSYFGAVLVGTLAVPVLLPWIPVRAFALKGFLLGLLYAFLLNTSFGYLFSADPDILQALINFLMFPAIASFLAMGFTGSSTYTSLSGVVKEMKFAVPSQAVSAILGLGLMVYRLIFRN